MDKIEQIASDAQISFGVVSNGTDFELIALDGKLSEDLTRELQAKKFCFVGIIGLINFVPRVALEMPLDPSAIAAITKSFLDRIDDAITKVEKANPGDSLGYLQRLYNLPDDRSEMN